MNFTYETQGAITYLVCELDSTEQIDSLALGMLTNNHIMGFAPVIYTEMNGQRYLKYNISAKVPATQFFNGTINKQRAIAAFQNILNAICSADDYMIDPSNFLVDSEHIFFNVSSCEVAMVCIPVIVAKDINAEVATFFKQIMSSVQFDNSEDMSYVEQISSYLENSATFNVYGFKGVIDRLHLSTPSVQAKPFVPQQQVARGPITPSSSFESTINIDSMNSPVVIPQQQLPQMITPPIQKVNIPTPPPAQVKPQQSVNVLPVGRQINNVSVQTPGNPISQGNAIFAPKPPVSQEPVPQKGPGFAIPGQSAIPAAAEPESKKKKTKTKPQTKSQPAEAGEKKMSLFGLLSHYNKENAELYKKQKAEAKSKKNEQVVPQPVNAAVQPAIPGKPASAPIQQPPVGNPYVSNIPRQQPVVQPQFQVPVQPLPIQNSFNETTVLNPAMIGGETTVLNANMSPEFPFLIRVKTGEKISINKPVFRIGKEKSYVDYFIVDNTAISRSHANIHTENKECFIEDTNSTNHTFINGTLINSNVKIKLANGDKIRLANEEFTFTI